MSPALLFLAVAAIGTVAYAPMRADAWAFTDLIENKENCPWSKDHIYTCISEFADTNHDNRLSREEMQVLLNSIPKAERDIIMRVLHGPTYIIEHCGDGIDKDAVSRDSFYAREDCLDKCFKLTIAIEKYCKPEAARRGRNFLAMVGLDRERDTPMHAM
jgi:hypothetical protein